MCSANSGWDHTFVSRDRNPWLFSCRIKVPYFRDTVDVMCMHGSNWNLTRMFRPLSDHSTGLCGLDIMVRRDRINLGTLIINGETPIIEACTGSFCYFMLA